MSSDALIRLEHVKKCFGSHVVLEDINLSCEKGRIYGFVGYNGSGKTVMFKCICGLMRPDRGKVWAYGKELGDHILEHAGIIIENPAFLSNLSGRKNLELLYMLNNKRNRSYIHQVMESVGLDPYSRKKVKDYSLGMRQRLAIGQAIMEDPEILILDEPMNGLDKSGIDEVRTMLLELKQRGKVIILASHNREDIQILCDEVYEMDHGEMKRLHN